MNDMIIIIHQSSLVLFSSLCTPLATITTPCCTALLLTLCSLLLKNIQPPSNTAAAAPMKNNTQYVTNFSNVYIQSRCLFIRWRMSPDDCWCLLLTLHVYHKGAIMIKLHNTTITSYIYFANNYDPPIHHHHTHIPPASATGFRHLLPQAFLIIYHHLTYYLLYVRSKKPPRLINSDFCQWQQ